MAGWSRGGVGGRYILCEHATIVKIWLLLFLAFVYVLKWKFLWKVEKKEKSSGIDGSMTSSSSWSSNNIHIWNFLVRRKIFCLFLLSLARVCKKAKRSVFDTWFHSNFFSRIRSSSLSSWRRHTRLSHSVCRGRAHFSLCSEWGPPVSSKDEHDHQHRHAHHHYDHYWIWRKKNQCRNKESYYLRSHSKNFVPIKRCVSIDIYIEMGMIFENKLI